MQKKLVSILLCLGLLLCAGGALAQQTHTPFGQFEAENLRGEEPVTEAAFTGAELTLVNFWATWCPPCREELPDLAEISGLSEGRVQVLGVLMDSFDTKGERDEDAIESANMMLDLVNADFPVVVPDAWLSAIASRITAVPTTLLVDREGNLLTAVTGARSAEQWMALADETLGAAK